jgi:hypothetical protein
LPWDDTEQYIRTGHRNPDEFQKETLRTITLNAKEGIKAVIGKPKGKHAMEVLSYLFEKEKGWTIEKAKEWFGKHNNPAEARVYAVLSFAISEKIMEKPLRIRGLAVSTGMSRNFNIYTPEELQAFAVKLVGAPVYIGHITAASAVGKVTRTEWDGQRLLYEAEICDEETADKIRTDLIKHVSVGADYETLDIIDGKVPHGLHDTELSLVAVPGIPEANIRVLEKLTEAEWNAAYVNDLPDAAFAVISKGGTKDSQNKN